MVLFPHSVYIGFRLFVLLERRSGDVSSMLRGYEGLFTETFCSTPLGAELSDGGNLRSAFRIGSAAEFPRAQGVIRGFSAISSLWENSCRCCGALTWHSLHLRSLLIERHFSERETLRTPYSSRCWSDRWFSSEELLQVDSGARTRHSLHLRDPLIRTAFLIRCKSFLALF